MESYRSETTKLLNKDKQETPKRWQQAALMCVETRKIYDVGNTCMYYQEFLGFGRPLSDDCIWVFAHAFLYNDNGRREDKIPKKSRNAHADLQDLLWGLCGRQNHQQAVAPHRDVRERRDV